MKDVRLVLKFLPVARPIRPPRRAAPLKGVAHGAAQRPALPYPPSSEGGPVEGVEWQAKKLGNQKSYPPSSEGGPVEGQLWSDFLAGFIDLSALLGGRPR